MNLTTAVILSLIYFVGVLLCYTMQRVEHESEGQVYTKGDRVINILFSFLSFVWVVVILIISWVAKISATGYWARPAKKEPAKVTIIKPEQIEEVA